MKFLKTIWSEIKEIKSGAKELREFGIVMAVFFGLLAAFLWWKSKNFLPMLGIAGIFAIFTAINPTLLKPLQKLWMAFAVIMGFFMTRLILGILFFLVITPLGVISRMTGKVYLDLDFKKAGDTYWHLDKKAPVKESYEKQF